jgi:hypothetical protein
MTANGTTICEPSDLVGLERTRFFARQLVGPDDLTQDQLYFREKARRHNRMLHGWGVVCGARVRQGDGDCDVVIEPGYVLGPYGDEVLIDREVVVDVCKEDLDGNAVSPCGDVDPWCADIRVDRRSGQPLYLAVRYAECESRPVRIVATGCGCDETECQYSRTRDSYAIKVLTSLPSTYTTPMVQPDPSIAVQCSGGGECGRVCGDCPAEPWVILADITLQGDQSNPTIDCYSHRRYVASFADYFYLCHPPRVHPGPVTAPGDLLKRLLGRPVLVDLTAGLRAEQPPASVPVRRPDGSWVTLPAFFDVHRNDTAAELLTREGDREFLDPATNERFKLRDLFALSQVDPKARISTPAEALAPLEGVQLRVGDLRVVRSGLEELLSSRGLDRLDEAHAGAPAAASELPARDISGIGTRSPLVRKLADQTVADVAGSEKEAFVAEALKDVPQARQKAVAAEANELWTRANRIANLSQNWRGGQ